MLQLNCGVMFHHFYDQKHPQGQGSISKIQFNSLIEKISENNIILHPAEFFERAQSGNIEDGYTCITFDDALLSQYEIAKPVLDKFGIKAIFNVYSSALQGKPSPLEIYRYFRTIKFRDIKEFYEDFNEVFQRMFPALYPNAVKSFAKNPEYLVSFSFYSTLDRQFRYYRDKFLSNYEYEKIMNSLMEMKEFDPTKVPELVFMNGDQLRNLHNEGHSIGLHSNTHPTNIDSLSILEQKSEYEINFHHLNELLGVRPIYMAHPCGRYSSETLSILRGLNIEIGFRSDVKKLVNRTMLELPREDHSNLISRLGIS